MSRERIEHIIAVQTAWKEGKQIEQSVKGKDDWRDKYTPFDWAVYDYRIKPEGKPIIKDVTEQREIDLLRAKEAVEEWLIEKGVPYDDGLFVKIQKAIMED